MTPLPDATPNERRAALRRGRLILFGFGIISADVDPLAYLLGTQVWEAMPGVDRDNERDVWEMARAIVVGLPETEIEGLGESLPEHFRTHHNAYGDLMIFLAQCLAAGRPIEES